MADAFGLFKTQLSEDLTIPTCRKLCAIFGVTSANTESILANEPQGLALLNHLESELKLTPNNVQELHDALTHLKMVRAAQKVKKFSRKIDSDHQMEKELSFCFYDMLSKIEDSVSTSDIEKLCDWFKFEVHERQRCLEGSPPDFTNICREKKILIQNNVNQLHEAVCCLHVSSNLRDILEGYQEIVKYPKFTLVIQVQGAPSKVAKVKSRLLATGRSLVEALRSLFAKKYDVHLDSITEGSICLILKINPLVGIDKLLQDVHSGALAENIKSIILEMESVGRNALPEDFSLKLSYDKETCTATKMGLISTATSLHGIETSTLTDGNPSVLLIDTVHKFSDPSNRIRMFDIAKEGVGYLSEKVILFVGETGTGKTTMINTMANYLLGNKWDDNHRYQLLSDKEETKSGSSQVQSRTQWITSYTFNVENKWRHNFTLIDSSGFGDLRGRERDHTLIKQMWVLFTNMGNGGIDHIDGVALVVNASLKRLTPNQKYIFDALLGLFGPNISDNIFLLCTHATDDELENRNPDVAESVQNHKISYKELFTFNNEFLYYQKKKGSKFAGSGRASTVWEIGEETLDEFIGKILDCTPTSLVLSSEVLQKRKNIEITIESLPGLIKSAITKMNEVKKEMEICKEHKDKMETHESFTYTVQVEKKVKKSYSEKATNCSHCERTCHYPCGNDFLMSIGVYMCAVMKYLGPGCSVCDCDASKHILESYKYENIVETQTRTKGDIKRKYEFAESNMKYKEALIETITKERDLAQTRVNEAVEKLRKCLRCLDEIALRTKSTSVREPLMNLKRQEIQAMEPGYEDRVKELEKLCQNERKYENSGNETKI